MVLPYLDCTWSASRLLCADSREHDETLPKISTEEHSFSLDPYAPFERATVRLKTRVPADFVLIDPARCVLTTPFQDLATPAYRVPSTNRSYFKMRTSHPTPPNSQSRPTPSSQHALRARQPSRRQRLSTLSISSVFTRSAMPSKFNIVRASLYGEGAQCSHLQPIILIKLALPSRDFGVDHNMPSHRSSLPVLTRHHRSKYVCLFCPNDLSSLISRSARFVPFAIFVCSVSLLILLVL